MHYKTIFFAIFTLFVAGSVSAIALPEVSQSATVPQASSGADSSAPSHDGIVFVCVLVASILTLLGLQKSTKI